MSPAKKNTKKKQAHIGYVLGMKKGIHRFIYRELCELDAKGFEISIFTTKYHKGLYNAKEHWKLYHFSLPKLLLRQIKELFLRPFSYDQLFMEALFSGTLPEFLLAAAYAPLTETIDKLHCHFGDRKFFVGYYLKKLTGKPLSVTIHAHELYRNPNFPFFKKALAACDTIVAISDYNKKYLVEHFDCDPKKIRVIRLFVDPESDTLDMKRKKMLIVGSFEERKGYDTLVDAVALLKRKDLMIWVVGEGHLPVQEWVEKKGLSDQFVFLGNLRSETLNILFGACDFFCLPSKTAKVKIVQGSNMTAEGIDCEGIPVALMEAMLAGKPVISTQHVGIPELVADILVDENDPKELAKAIRTLLDSPKKYATMGKKNKAIIAKKYSKKNIQPLAKMFKE